MPTLCHLGSLRDARPHNVVLKSLLWSDTAGPVHLLLWLDRVLVVVYHHPEPDAVGAHLTHLRMTAEPIGPLELYRPSNAARLVVITIEDGNVGNRDLVGVFAAYGRYATISVATWRPMATNFLIVLLHVS